VSAAGVSFPVSNDSNKAANECSVVCSRGMFETDSPLTLCVCKLAKNPRNSNSSNSSQPAHVCTPLNWVVLDQQVHGPRTLQVHVELWSASIIGKGLLHPSHFSLCYRPGFVLLFHRHRAGLRKRTGPGAFIRRSAGPASTDVGKRRLAYVALVASICTWFCVCAALLPCVPRVCPCVLRVSPVCTPYVPVCNPYVESYLRKPTQTDVRTFTCT
jgi:hypothetical protein